MSEISFETSKEDALRIARIVARANDLSIRVCGRGVDRFTLDMDITTVHCNGCPLDLEKLLAADDFNFAHDVFQIPAHINRHTGALEHCFLPRCAKVKGEET